MTLKLAIDGKELSGDEITNFVKTYKKDIEQNPRLRYSRMLSLVGSGKKILDFGCGWGSFSVMMMEMGLS